uniref:E3 ubiquitin-protein ligase n=1 Tax=Knipowitschia caucasica TaxID=637954 RepID=A0AAV2KI16_KNICA
MADRGQTVRVTGLPTEIELEKLEDKLCIHFQRSKNGGGDVASVTTVKTSPDFALITFEDSRVAQRVIQQTQHFLEVDGKRFNLTVKEHPGHQLQDKIIINLSATVDCSQFSAAKKTLSGLNKKHPDVQMNYDSARELCTLCGSYSAVQAVLSQVLGQNGLLQTKESVKMTTCELTICPTCASYLHVACRTCEAEERKARGIKGTMTYATLPMSLPGHIKHPVVKITYSIPDGIQGESDVFPGQPFKGGTFEAFLPDCEPTRKLLPRLQEALSRGHTFAVIGGRVQWDSIPHKTSLQEGKAAGYPDSTYLSRMSEVLTSLGIP